MKRKKEFIIVLVSLLVIILSVSVAYFTIRILGTGKEIGVDFAELKVIFTSGNGTINGTNIEPGWSSGENTFTVKNESNGTYNYNIIIKDLVNTFVTEGFLVYKITSTDGGYNMTDFADVPKSSAATDTVLAENISINKGATHTYKIEIKYLESSTVNQDEDQGKTLSGKIFIEKYTESEYGGYLVGSLGERILNNNSTISTRSDFSTPFTTNTVNTLYKATENGTDVYYFAGISSVEGHCEYDGQSVFSVGENKLTKSQCLAGNLVCKVGEDVVYLEEGDCENDYEGTLLDYAGEWIEEELLINNWVKFANFYWRIIRTNSDGSIRLLYSGTSPDTTEGYIGKSAFNTNHDSPKYVGYMYGDSDTTLEEARTNTNDSTIKTYIDSWYNNNLSSFSKYISTTAVYCNDRELASGAKYSTTASFDYATNTRLRTNKTPTYDCTNDDDKFTVDASSGNGKLTYPIALMTADEIAYAGGVVHKIAPMWYYTNSTHNSITKTDWWLLSPNSKFYIYFLSGRVISEWYGGLGDDISNNNNAVRPVTSLKSCVQWKSGDGSADNPYEIVENGGC